MLKNGTVRTLGLASRVWGRMPWSGRKTRLLAGQLPPVNIPNLGWCSRWPQVATTAASNALTVGANAVVAFAVHRVFRGEITQIAAGQEFVASYRQ